MNFLRFFFVVFAVTVTLVTSQTIGPELDLEGSPAQQERELYPTTGDAAECQDCACPQTPTCSPGVSLLQDGCGCCKICARQLGEECDVRRVCDFHKGLYCDITTGVCEASPGRDCNVGGRWYRNGELFQPSCRATCSCIDGDLGCVPTCNTPRSSPASLSCRHPRLIRRKGQCCGEWACLKGGRLGKNMLPFENELKGRENMQVTFRNSCMIQTTEWSPCSKTCGFGVSDRVSNDNENCQLQKQTRLCNHRPCSMTKDTVISRRRPCRKNIRKNKRVRFSLSGCLSSETYRTKYCGFCGDKCCKPRSTKTVSVEFACRNNGTTTSTFSRDMMVIKKCACEECYHDNNIFSVAYRGGGSDMFRFD